MMNHFRSFSDTAAISLSLLCTIHCLLLPLFLAWLPTTMALTVENEAFHFFMVLMVIPLSVFALFMGCKKHQNYRVLALGFLGLSFLLLAVILGHDVLGEAGEKRLTVAGSVLIGIGHILNYHLCRHDEDCPCSEAK